MKDKRVSGGIAMILLAIALTGCGLTSYHPEQSGIFVRKNGTVKGAEIESFDNSAYAEPRYQEDELKAFVEETVSSYNQETTGQTGAYSKDADGLKVTIDDFSVKNSVATLVLNYATTEDYIEFNDGGENVLTLDLMTAPEAAEAGAVLTGLKDSEGNSVAEDAASNEKYYVVSVSGNTEVTVEGKILGISDGGSITGKRTAEVSSETEVLILFR